MRNTTFILAISVGLLFGCKSSENKKIIAQNKTCFCENDSLINHYTVECDTILLSNKSKLFWQFNCDRIWLTLDNVNGQKKIIDSLQIELYPLTYRLGYHLIKEFDNTILFRSGCPANGPCVYNLIDKFTGEKIKEFDQLICIDTEDDNYNFEFIVYLSDTTDHIIIYYINNEKLLKIPFAENLTSMAYPQQQFEEMTLKNNNLELTYWTNDNTKKTLNINLKDEKYSQ